MTSDFQFTEHSEVRIPGGNFESVHFALQRLQNYCESRGLEKNYWKELELAVAEALNNALGHGCIDHPHGIVIMRWWWVDDVFMIEIIDPGSYLPPAQDISLPEDLLAGGGRGMFLIAQLTNRVEHFLLPEGHCIRLEKKVGHAAPAAGPGHADTERSLAAMTEEVGRCYEIISALFRFSRELAVASTFSDFLRRALTRLMVVVPAERAIARFLNPEKTAIVQLGFVSEGPVRWPQVLTLDTPSIEVAAAVKGHAIGLETCGELAESDPMHGWSHGVYVCPITSQAETLGSLLVTQKPGNGYFSAGEMNLIHYVADFMGGIRAMHLLDEQRQQDQLTLRELEIAASMQQELLPKAFPRVGEYSTGGFCVSARQVGGDYFDIIELPDEALLLVIADVMGKGVSAAFWAAIFRTAVHARLDLASRPGDLLTEVNRQMGQDLARLGMFITAQLVYLSTRGNRCFMSNAGHCPVLHFEESGRRVIRHYGDGMPLGIMSDTVYGVEEFGLDHGDNIILLTDGLYEVENEGGAMLGLDRFAQRMEQIFQNEEPDETQKLLRFVSDYEARRSASDDRALVHVRRA